MQSTTYSIAQSLTFAQSLTLFMSLILSIIVLGTVLGVLYKVFFVFLSIVAYPTYLGLHFIEHYFPFIKLNRAKKGSRSLLMDSCASIVTLYSCQVLLPNIADITGASNPANAILETLQRAPLAALSSISPNSSAFVWIPFIALIVVYAISFFEEPDTHEAIDKMKNLSAEGPWKKLLGS
jgi:hypothetical protein